MSGRNAVGEFLLYLSHVMTVNTIPALGLFSVMLSARTTAVFRRSKRNTIKRGGNKRRQT
jgi:hypothetical protein